MARYDFTDVDRFEGDFKEFYLSPKKWREFSTNVSLNWTNVKFSKQNRTIVPKTRGIYAFVVEYCESQFPPHGYIVYLGITGNSSQNRTLRTRFGEYLRGVKNEKRDRVKWMLNKFNQDLYFHFAEVKDARVSLPKIETALLDAIQPFCNKKDFSGGRMKTMRAFR